MIRTGSGCPRRLRASLQPPGCIRPAGSHGGPQRVENRRNPMAARDQTHEENIPFEVPVALRNPCHGDDSVQTSSHGGGGNGEYHRLRTRRVYGLAFSSSQGGKILTSTQRMTNGRIIRRIEGRSPSRVAKPSL